MGDKESPFDIDADDDIDDILEKVAQDDAAEGSVGPREVALLTVRTFTVFLLVLGSVWLVVKVLKRKRGSWREVVLAVSIQIVWQVIIIAYLDGRTTAPIDCVMLCPALRVNGYT